jgi:hypothetical protein
VNDLPGFSGVVPKLRPRIRLPATRPSLHEHYLVRREVTVDANDVLHIADNAGAGEPTIACFDAM